MSEPTLQECAAEFRSAVQSVADIADEVAEHVEADNLDSAILPLATGQGKLADLLAAWKGLQQRLSDAGASCERALGRSS